MFKKNDILTLYFRSDSLMRWRAVRVRVDSCGKKQMHLYEESTGKFLGRDFLPAEEQRSGYCDGPKTSFVTRELDMAKVEEMARAQAEVVNAFEIMVNERCIRSANERGDSRFATHMAEQGAKLRGATFSFVVGYDDINTQA